MYVLFYKCACRKVYVCAYCVCNDSCGNILGLHIHSIPTCIHIHTHLHTPAYTIHLRLHPIHMDTTSDEHAALDWVLRADVERTALLEEEAKLEKHIHDPSGILPQELKGVNLQLALQEVGCMVYGVQFGVRFVMCDIVKDMRDLIYTTLPCIHHSPTRSMSAWRLSE
ncbi:hypothetical protein EON63_24005 [archaeon]|nr:MAG: hypothetical protein EON63_24005 [archaeon]